VTGGEGRPSPDADDGPAALKRLRMRSWRRGTREMDLILGPFADRALDGLGSRLGARYAALLSENDQDLYLWIAGSVEAPPEFLEIVEKIRAFHSLEGQAGAM
jgi:antitoxin CptB